MNNFASKIPKKADPGSADFASPVQKEATKIYDSGETQSPKLSSATLLANWYTQQPYGFSFKDKTFYLPIAPSNLNITTHFATNMISTMYGTIEEHSEQRYFDITIAGTTGMVPKYYRDVEGLKKDPVAYNGRIGPSVKSFLDINTGGFARRTQALIQNISDSVSDLLGGPEPKSGVRLEQSGYAAFHNFYKFLLLHKKAVMHQDGVQKLGKGNLDLIFKNYKDNNQYNVVINTFTLTRDSNNPMLYNYNITMRAYNLAPINAEDREGLSVADRQKDLGLDGIKTSLFARMSNAARQTKNTAYSAIAAAKGFGA